MNDIEMDAMIRRIYKSKGFDPETDDDTAEIMLMQLSAWHGIFNRHRIMISTERMNEVFQGFAGVKVYRKADVFPEFREFMEKQPKQFATEPDWESEARRVQYEPCPYCENRGVISDVPVRSPSGKFEGVRTYSFRCKCFASAKFAGVPVAEDWMYEFAINRNRENMERLRQWGQRNGITARSEDEFRVQFRRWLNEQKGKMFKSVNDPPPQRKRKEIDTRVLEEVRPSKKLEAPKEEAKWNDQDDEILATL